MKILLITGPDITLKEPFSSGIESFVVTLANKLVREGHYVDVIAKDAEPSILFNVINNLDSVSADEYDVIHHNLFIPELYKAATSFKKPSVLTLHSPVDEMRSKTYKSFAKNNDVTFVAVSERIANQWTPALNIPMPVYRNGIDLSQWPVKQVTSDGYLLWSGRINKQKNPLAAIQVAKHTGSSLKIAGRITDQRYFDTYVKPHLNDSIEYVGHTTQKELSALAHSASVFLATAIWEEPFGLAALEMLASGLPVIGFETAIPADLRQSGASYTVPSNDWHDLVPLLKFAKDSTPQDCRSFARTMDDDQMVKGYISLYKNISSGNGIKQIPDYIKKHRVRQLVALS